MFPLSLVKIGRIVKNRSSFLKSQMEADAVLNYGYVDFFDLTDVI